MATADANGLSIFYVESGSGIPLVLSHGGMADHAQWASQMSALSAGHRVITWDRRNCGQTEPKGMDESPELWVEDLRSFLDALGIDRAFVGGVSYGGLLSLEFALRHPERTMAALIVSATGEGFAPTDNFTIVFPSRLDDLPGMRVPCLVVQGLQDTVFPPAMGEALAAGIPGAQLALLDGGHSINQERPEEFNRVVSEFLAKVEA